MQEPGESSLHYPSSGQYLEALPGIGAQHHLPAPAPELSDEAPQVCSLVAAVHPYQLEAAAELAQAQTAAQVAQQAHGPHLLRDAGRAHPHGQQQPLGVGEQEALAAIDLLGGVVAPVSTATGRGLDAL